MVWYGMVWCGGAVYLWAKIVHNRSMILKILKLKNAKSTRKTDSESSSE